MREHPTLTWNKLIGEANGLGLRMKILSEAIATDPATAEEYDELCGYTEEDPAELHKLMWGIAAVLRLLMKTANAHLNAEGMTAILWELEMAESIAREAKPIFDRISPDWM